MRLKTYNALNIQDAMQMVRDDLGDDAVIVSTSRNPKGKGVTVTVAQDGEAHDFGPAVIIEKGEHEPATNGYHHGAKRTMLPDYIVRDIEQILDRHGIPHDLIEKLLDSVRSQPQPPDDTDESLRLLLTHALKDIFRFEPLDFLKQGYRYILIGTPGAGKTLTASKLAARIVQAGKTVRLVTTDNKRAGAIEQLSAYADVLGLEAEVAESRAELKAIIKSLRPEDRLIVDTAGANPFDFHELKELAEFAGLMELEPLLVFPAGTDPRDAAEIAQAFTFIGVEKILYTRLDIAKRYGALLTASHAAQLTVTQASAGEKILEQFDAADAPYMARLLMDYRTKRA